MDLYRAPSGFVNLDSARQSRIEASKARGPHEEDHAQIGQADEKDRFCKVAASPNSQNQTERGITKRVKAFLQKHWDQKSPLLLGYSGGPDSKVLLYTLVKLQIPLELGHVDHGWRKESEKEALLIQAEARELNLPCHIHRLEGPAPCDRENEARKKRWAFFRQLMQAKPYQAVVFGHQADDVAETTLKRVLEGAHLPMLGGMEGVTLRDGVAVWRPMLGVSKREILANVKRLYICPFDDPTNRDPLYLRSRMREDLLPYLEKKFGKGVSENLRLLSERAQEFHHYLEKKIAPSLEKVQNGTVSREVLAPLERLEQRYLLQRVLANQGILLPRELLEDVLDWLSKGGKKRALKRKEGVLRVEKGHFYIEKTI